MPPRDPKLTALKSSEAELDAAAVITPEDIARAQANAPAILRPYLDATPDPADEDPSDAT